MGARFDRFMTLFISCLLATAIGAPKIKAQTNASGKGEANVTTLIQKEHMVGHVELHISENNEARLDCSFGNVLYNPKIAKLTMFSEKSRKFCEVSEHDFEHKRRLFTASSPYTWPMSKWQPEGKILLLGKPTLKYVRHCTNLPPHRQFIEECWMYTGIKTPHWLPHYVNMVMCVASPDVPGVLMRFRRTWIDTHNQREPKEVQMKLDTTKIFTHNAEKALFTLPPGLMRVKDEMEVTMGSQMDSTVGAHLKSLIKH